jgi:flagellar protein FlaJ
MDQYSIKYEGALMGLELLNEVFVAVVVLATLVVSMFLIIPMLVRLPLPPLGMLILGTFLFAMIEGTFLFAYWIVLPRESVWQKSDISNKTNRQLFLWFFYSFIICDIIAVVLVVLYLGFNINLPLPLAVAIVITPLTISGYKALIEERDIKKKEDRYPAYMRSLGISAAARGGVAREALAKLRHHDFGPLTKHINDLYKRLAMRVDEIRSWKFFNAEVGSDLISKFSDMYVRGTLAGAKPKEASSIVSTNFIKMLQLRKKRYQASSTLIYILYGVTVTLAITVFMTIYTVDWVVQFAYKMPHTPEFNLGNMIPVLANPGIFDIPGLVNLGLLLVIINAFICATIIRFASAGHSVNFLLHFVGLVWVGTIIAILTEYVMKMLRMMGT